MRVPGRLRGLGPIEAARVELQGTIDARDYGSNWLSTSAVPNGILTTEQPLSPEQATQYKNAWTGYDPVTDTTTPPGHTPRVMGQGVKYEFLGIKPKDAQFLETRQFNTTEIARLFGIPASLILATVEGGSQSYANIEQDWIGFTRFTMMAYLTEIEDAFSALLPYGETAKFVIDELLRTDTKTRFEAHEIALRARFKTRNEVRADEGLAAIAGGDELDPVTAPAVAAIPRAAAGPSRPPSLAQIGA
jgi:HK97 family phage portal protein